MRRYLKSRQIPYYAFTHAIPGKATAAHIHIGPGSTRLITPPDGHRPMALVPRVFLTAEQIQKRVHEMGDQISNDFPQGPIYLIAILKGAFMFLADLSRTIERRPAWSLSAYPVTAAGRPRRGR